MKHSKNLHQSTGKKYRFFLKCQSVLHVLWSANWMSEENSAELNEDGTIVYNTNSLYTFIAMCRDQLGGKN